MDGVVEKNTRLDCCIVPHTGAANRGWWIPCIPCIPCTTQLFFKLLVGILCDVHDDTRCAALFGLQENAVAVRLCSVCFGSHDARVPSDGIGALLLQGAKHHGMGHSHENDSAHLSDT